MILLAAPYNVQSSALLARDGGAVAFEILARGCFTKDLARGKRVRLLRGHGGPLIGRVRPFETDRGVFFHYDGTLPADFTGCSVRLKPLRWQRLGPQLFLLTEARLRHVALLCGDEVPAYPQTRMESYKYEKIQ